MMMMIVEWWSNGIVGICWGKAVYVRLKYHVVPTAVFSSFRKRKGIRRWLRPELIILLLCRLLLQNLLLMRGLILIDCVRVFAAQWHRIIIHCPRLAYTVASRMNSVAGSLVAFRTVWIMPASQSLLAFLFAIFACYYFFFLNYNYRAFPRVILVACSIVAAKIRSLLLIFLRLFSANASMCCMHCWWI